MTIILPSTALRIIELYRLFRIVRCYLQKKPKDIRLIQSNDSLIQYPSLMSVRRVVHLAFHSTADDD